MSRIWQSQWHSIIMYFTNIAFIGFSFGGLLAKAVSARMWREPLLSVESLQENIACISLAAPMITLPVVTMAMEETPQFGSTVHSIVLNSDPIPKLTMFLDPRCEEVGSETLLPSLRKPLEVRVRTYVSNVLIHSFIHRRYALQSLVQCTDTYLLFQKSGLCMHAYIISYRIFKDRSHQF